MLVTRCPVCSTAFKVVRDQLKLSHGWVRCGRCAHVFDASLYFFEATPPPVAPAKAVPAVATAPVPSHASGAATSASDTAQRRSDSPTAQPPPARVASVAAAGEAVAHEPGPSLGAAQQPPQRAPAPVDLPSGAPHSAAAMSRSPDLRTDDAIAAPQARAMDQVLGNLGHVGGWPSTPTPPGADRTATSTSAPVPPQRVSATHQSDEPLELISRFPEEAASMPAPAASVASVDLDVLGSVRTPGANARRHSAESPAASGRRDDRDVRAASESSPKPSARQSEPRFLVEARRRAMWSSWPMRLLLTLLLLIGSTAAVLQLGYWFRADLMRTTPALRPALEALCEALVCSIDAVERIEAIVIESSSMTLSGERSVELNAVLRSRERVDNRWPQIELTLTDSRDQLIARRVFDPADYLPHAMAQGARTSYESAMKPLTEYPIKLTLDIESAPPAGYRLAVFYR